MRGIGGTGALDDFVAIQSMLQHIGA